MGLVPERGRKRFVLALESRARMAYELEDTGVEREPDHLCAGGLVAHPPHFERSVRAGVGAERGNAKRFLLPRDHPAPGAGARRTDVLCPLLVPGAEPQRAERPVRRLLGTEQEPRVD